MGLSGEMLLIWDKDRVEMTETLKGAFSLSIRCKFLQKDEEVVFTGSLAPVVTEERILG